MNSCYITPRRNRRHLFFIGLTALLLPLRGLGQAAAPCYQPITGPSAVVQSVQNDALCAGCSYTPDSSNIIDSDPNNFAVYNTSIGLATGSGVSVRDTVNTYAAGYYAGYVVDMGSDPLALSALSSLQIQTYLDGTLRETRNSTNGLSVSLLSGAAGKVYLSFKTTQSFDEVRFTFGSTLGVINNLRIYYAMAFEGSCGYVDNNSICYDQIGNPKSIINFNGGLVNALVTLGNAPALVDGNKNTAAVLTLPAGVSLLATPPFVGVKDLEQTYPAGTKAGFVIGYNASLLSADVLNTLSLQTYLHGELQETALASGAGSVLKLNALSATGTDKKEISFSTTLPYNEVRLVVAQPATVNVGSINIYYAFESGASCTDCRQALISSAPSPYTGSVNAANTGVTGTLCLSSIGNTANLVDTSLTNAATFNTTLGVNCNARFAVRNDGPDFPAGTFAGFAMNRQGGLLTLGLLDAITVNLYRDGGATPVASNSGAALLGAGLLTGTDSVGFFGFKSTVAFDEIQININAGLLAVGLGGTYNVRYAYVIRDDDNDGVADCSDVCGLAANDSLDADNDGTPNPCDACNAVNSKSAVADIDHDGVPDACDADSDNDGIADAREDANGNGNPDDDDRDNDGIPNYQDLDSDNDGINDIAEAGLSPAQLLALDANGDGVIDASVPKGTNGLANDLETADAAGAQNNYTSRNRDGDGAADYLDLDSDNDGVNDITESGFAGTDADNDGMIDGPDGDRDGIRNSADGNTGTYGDASGAAARDRDSDGIPDYRDLDSDNDGINDLRESGFPGLTDANGDGIVDGPDSDGDGIVDAADGRTGANGDAGAATLRDADGDGVPDLLDLDSDNDGLNDVRESGLPLTADADNNGLVDGADNDGDGIVGVADGNDAAYGDAADPAQADTDGDGIPDARDLDSDNDGINDIRESGQPGAVDTNGDGIVDGPDTDGDGIRDGVDGNTGSFGDGSDPSVRDSDRDGIPDARDLDSDNDGINDIRESGQPGIIDADNDGVVDGPDADGDGIRDSADNIDTQFGDNGDTASKDTDNDGIPDARDLDSDNDSISDLVESGHPGVTDADNNGVADGPDTDGDGIMNSVDGSGGFGDGSDPALKDDDSDGVPDYNDLDSDPSPGTDIQDNGYGDLDGDGDGRVDGPTDPDGDGIPNNDGLDFDPNNFGGLGRPTNLSIKAMLQGALFFTSGGLMRDNLRTMGLIPLTSPYSSAMSVKFTNRGTGGGEQTTTAVLNANAGTGDAIVDWIFIEFRKADSPTVVIQTVAGLLQRDGDVVLSSGLPFRTVMPLGNYYVAVKHRNHLGIMTNAPVVISGESGTVDFINASDADIYNNNGFDGNERMSVNGIKALWGGNVNINVRCTYEGSQNDRTALLSQVLNAPGNTSQLNNYANAIGYYTGDVNMNGKASYEGSQNDRSALLNIILNAPLNTGLLNNFVLVVEQLP